MLFRSEVEGLPEFAKATRVTRKNAIYILCNKYPKNEMIITNPLFTADSKVCLLGCDQAIEFAAGDKTLTIKAPYLTVDEMPCKNVYTFKITLK